MKTITKYITFDGEEFDTETDALEYECFLHSANHVKFWDEKLNELTINNDSDIDDVVDRIDYINILDEEGLKQVQTLFEYVGYVDYPDCIGIFFYGRQNWVNMADWITEVKTRYNKLQIITQQSDKVSE